MLGAVCTPKATLFHWNFPYGQVNAVYGLESGCIEIDSIMNKCQVWKNILYSLTLTKYNQF